MSIAKRILISVLENYKNKVIKKTNKTLLYDKSLIVGNIRRNYLEGLQIVGPITFKAPAFCARTFLVMQRGTPP
jgi:hypothetical protein